MKKTIKYIGAGIGSLLTLFFVFITFLTVYPDLSEIRQRCTDIVVGMERKRVEDIMSELLGSDLDLIITDESHIFVMNNAVDCEIKFDKNGIVTEVTSAVVSF